MVGFVTFILKETMTDLYLINWRWKHSLAILWLSLQVSGGGCWYGGVGGVIAILLYKFKVTCTFFTEDSYYFMFIMYIYTLTLYMY